MLHHVTLCYTKVDSQCKFICNYTTTHQRGLNSQCCWPTTAYPDCEKPSMLELEALQDEGLFSRPNHTLEGEKPTRAFLELSTNVAMLFAPFGCTCLPCSTLSAHTELNS